MRYVRLGLAAVVVAVWLVGYALAYTRGTPAPTELTALMVPVLTWALGGEFLERVKARKGDDGEA